MSIAFLLLPEFGLILLGMLLYRSGWFAKDFWSGLEKLIYFVLFPVLLFNSTARSPIDFSLATPLLLGALGVIIVGVALGYTVTWLFKLERHVFASVFQCAFRFNSYVGLAVVSKLQGEPGMALFGLMLGICIPLVNIISVWMFARGNDLGVWRSLIQNPLVVATLSGLLFNLMHITLPDLLQNFLSRLGGTAIILGLIAVGAALRLSSKKMQYPLFAYITVIKLVILPLVALAIIYAFAFARSYAEILLSFAALPTASSAYILAVQMRGDGEIVARFISLHTLLSVVTIPFWLSML